jgi:hypothetical protein
MNPDPHAAPGTWKAAASTLAGQELTADSGMFTAWLQAHAALVLIYTVTSVVGLPRA